LKEAVKSVGTENSLKLWNKLLPAWVPPVILKVCASCMTLELVGRVPSGTIGIWATAEFVLKASVCDTAKAIAPPTINQLSSATNRPQQLRQYVVILDIVDIKKKEQLILIMKK
jgi:hypothetical protein